MCKIDRRGGGQKSFSRKFPICNIFYPGIVDRKEECRQKQKNVDCRRKKKIVDCIPKKKNVDCRPKRKMWIVDRKKCML